jgi:hypothetical protein
METSEKREAEFRLASEGVQMAEYRAFISFAIHSHTMNSRLQMMIRIGVVREGMKRC